MEQRIDLFSTLVLICEYTLRSVDITYFILLNMNKRASILFYLCTMNGTRYWFGAHVLSGIMILILQFD